MLVFGQISQEFVVKKSLDSNASLFVFTFNDFFKEKTEIEFFIKNIEDYKTI